MNAHTHIETDGLERIAWASSESENRPTFGVAGRRWTELGLYFRPGERYPFLAEVVGRSTVAGEQDMRRQRQGKSIAAACMLFDHASRLTDQVVEQVQAWLEMRGARTDAAAGVTGRPAPVIRWNGAGGLRGALEWLYGDQGDGAELTEGGLSMLFEKDWGVPARTVRHTLQNEKAGASQPDGGRPSWCNAFLGALQHFDREAFLATRRP